MLENQVKIYSINDLISLLQVSRKTLIAYIQKGKLKAFKVGNAYRVTDDSLKEYIRKSMVVTSKR